MKLTIAAITLVLIALVPACVAPVTPKPVSAPVRFTLAYVTDADVPVQVTRRTIPVYPSAFRSAGISGYAVVEFIVDANGAPREVQCSEASDIAFGQAAIDSISHWQFKPALKAGQPIATQMKQRMEFSTTSEG